MQNVYLGRGHGYEISDRGRCDLFDGFTVIANPLGGHSEVDREKRVFGRQLNGNGGTCYRSHVLSLALRDFGRGLFLLVEHGGGRELWAVPVFYDGGALESAILALPEPIQYALLHNIYRMASEARLQGQSETRDAWAKAHVEKRIKTRRRDNRRYVEIVDPSMLAPVIAAA